MLCRYVCFSRERFRFARFLLFPGLTLFLNAALAAQPRVLSPGYPHSKSFVDSLITLKAEFQGFNRDIYRPETIIPTSAK
jgi:hypothetical protein